MICKFWLWLKGYRTCSYSQTRRCNACEGQRCEGNRWNTRCSSRLINVAFCRWYLSPSPYNTTLNDYQGAEFWGALESVFRPFESRDLDFLRTSATLDEDSAMRVFTRHFLLMCVCSFTCSALEGTAHPALFTLYQEGCQGQNESSEVGFSSKGTSHCFRYGSSVVPPLLCARRQPKGRCCSNSAWHEPRIKCRNQHVSKWLEHRCSSQFAGIDWNQIPCLLVCFILVTSFRASTPSRRLGLTGLCLICLLHYFGWTLSAAKAIVWTMKFVQSWCLCR